MKLLLKIKNKDYEVDILEKGSNLSIRVGEKSFVFGRGERQAECSRKESAVSFSKEVRAPLSGIVSEIFVKEGEAVEAGEKVAALSAMKMENEIVSESSGKVKKIMVKIGDRAKEGEVLIIFE